MGRQSRRKREGKSVVLGAADPPWEPLQKATTLMTPDLLRRRSPGLIPSAASNRTVSRNASRVASGHGSASASARAASRSAPVSPSAADQRGALLTMTLGDMVFTTYKNHTYTVQVRDVPPRDGWPDLVWLSIRRNDRGPCKSWRDFQRIKDELVGPMNEGVELYPSHRRLVDTANQYHIWVLKDPDVKFPFGFDERLVQDAGEGPQIGAVQEPLRGFGSYSYNVGGARHGVSDVEVAVQGGGGPVLLAHGEGQVSGGEAAEDQGQVPQDAAAGRRVPEAQGVAVPTEVACAGGEVP